MQLFRMGRFNKAALAPLLFCAVFLPARSDAASGAEVFRKFMARFAQSSNYERLSPWDKKKTTSLSWTVEKLGTDKWKAEPFIQCGSEDACPGFTENAFVYFIRDGKVYQGEAPSPETLVNIDVAASSESKIVLVFEDDKRTYRYVQTWSLSAPGPSTLFTYKAESFSNGKLSHSEVIRFQN